MRKQAVHMMKPNTVITPNGIAWVYCGSMNTNSVRVTDNQEIVTCKMCVASMKYSKKIFAQSKNLRESQEEK